MKQAVSAMMYQTCAKRELNDTLDMLPGRAQKLDTVIEKHQTSSSLLRYRLLKAQP